MFSNSNTYGADNNTDNIVTSALEGIQSVSDLSTQTRFTVGLNDNSNVSNYNNNNDIDSQVANKRAVVFPMRHLPPQYYPNQQQGQQYRSVGSIGSTGSIARPSSTPADLSSHPYSSSLLLQLQAGSSPSQHDYGALLLRGYEIEKKKQQQQQLLLRNDREAINSNVDMSNIAVLNSSKTNSNVSSRKSTPGPGLEMEYVNTGSNNSNSHSNVGAGFDSGLFSSSGASDLNSLLSTINITKKNANSSYDDSIKTHHQSALSIGNQLRYAKTNLNGGSGGNGAASLKSTSVNMFGGGGTASAPPLMMYANNNSFSLVGELNDQQHKQQHPLSPSLELGGLGHSLRSGLELNNYASSNAPLSSRAGSACSGIISRNQSSNSLSGIGAMGNSNNNTADFMGTNIGTISRNYSSSSLSGMGFSSNNTNNNGNNAAVPPSRPHSTLGVELGLGLGLGKLEEREVQSTPVTPSSVEAVVLRCCRDILVGAAEHSLKAVELANTLRARG